MSNGITTQKVCLRRAELMKYINTGNVKKLLQMFAKDARLRDPDHSWITGNSNLIRYFTTLLKFAKKQSFPPMQLKSKRMVLKGEYIYDFGEYRWGSTMECGSYFHKWVLIKNDYYLMSYSFTIEENFENDENIDISL